jgi:hypothetical protein
MTEDDLASVVSMADRHVHKYINHSADDIEIRKLELTAQIEADKTRQMEIAHGLHTSDVVTAPANADNHVLSMRVESATAEVPRQHAKFRAITRGPKVQRYSPDGAALIKTYPSFMEASRDADLHDNAPCRSAIAEAIKDRTIYKGFRWAALDRDAPDSTVQNIGETNDSANVVQRGFVAALNLDRTRIERVFSDQKDAAVQLKLKGLASVSMALQMCDAETPRMTRGTYLRYWRNCAPDLRDEYLTRGELPEPRVSARALSVVATNVVTGETRRFASIAHVQRDLRMGRARVFECDKHGYVVEGYTLQIEGRS